MNAITNKHIHHNESGFTLIEVMITIFLITVGVMAVAKMQVQALQADRVAYNQTEAAMYAANKAEELINLDFDDAELSEGDHPTDPEDKFVGMNDKYEVTWTVGLADSDPTNTKVIQIFVDWLDKDGPRHMNFSYVKTSMR